MDTITTSICRWGNRVSARLNHLSTVTQRLINRTGVWFRPADSREILCTATRWARWYPHMTHTARPSLEHELLWVPQTEAEAWSCRGQAEFNTLRLGFKVGLADSWPQSPGIFCSLSQPQALPRGGRWAGCVDGSAHAWDLVCAFPPSPGSEDQKVECIHFSTWQLLIINAQAAGSSLLCHIIQKIYGHFESGFEICLGSLTFS